MKKEIRNMTPHKVSVFNDQEEVVAVFEPVGLARCTQSTQVIGSVNGINITDSVFGEVEGLPEEQPGVYFIVSRLCLSACPNRHDLLVPNELVRDEDGNIIGCRSFSIK